MKRGQVFSGTLTKRQREILTVMVEHPDDDDGELVYDGGGVYYLGDDRVASRTVFALLRLCVIISLEGDGLGRGLVRYRINETGRRRVGGDDLTT